MSDKPETTLADGTPVTDDHRELKPNGQQKGYVVLSEAERAKGYARPVRKSYTHIGIQPKHPTRPLSDKQKETFGEEKYVAYEEYSKEERPKVGRYWTAEQLAGGCGGDTVMADSIAETYARDPKFYGATMCAICGSHFPVAEFVWAGTDEVVGS